MSIPLLLDLTQQVANHGSDATAFGTTSIIGYAGWHGTIRLQIPTQAMKPKLLQCRNDYDSMPSAYYLQSMPAVRDWADVLCVSDNRCLRSKI